MSKRGGSLAFPSDGPDGTPGYSGGMTLRQYYKGQALASWGESHHQMTHPVDRKGTLSGNICYAFEMARVCGEIADAMLAEGEANDG